MKKILAMLLAVMMAVSLLPGTARAEEEFDIVDGVLVKYNGNGGDVVIPEGVTAIGIGVFQNRRNLTSVVIPKGVTTIGERAFYHCEGLTSVVIPDGVTTLGQMSFSGCTNMASVSIPSSMITIGVTAFSNCYSLTSVVIPEGVTTIGNGAFYACKSLTNITIPESVTVIGDTAFADCTNLRSVTLPSSVTEISSFMFSGCGFTSVTIPESVTIIGNGAFLGCYSLTSVTISEGVTEIGEDVFYDCRQLNDINVTEGNKFYTSVDGVLFSRDKSVLVAYPTGRTGSYVVPNGTTAVGSKAFNYCTGLTDVTIPEGVTTIGEMAFGACGLISVTIPVSVTSISVYAFLGNNKLTDVYYGGNEEQWEQIFIDEENEPLLNATIHFSVVNPEPTPEPEEPETPETPAASEIFTDVESGTWYEGAVSFAYANGLMRGVDDGKFDPEGITGRAQLMTILARLDGADTEGGAVWYEKAMAWAVEKGISDGSDPDGDLTREQLATMLWRYAGEPAATASLASFSDAAKVSGWASAALTWAVEQGIINGDNGRLKPQDTASRAEMATMLMRFCEKLEK